MSASGKFSRSSAATSVPSVVRECSNSRAISGMRWHLLTGGGGRWPLVPPAPVEFAPAALRGHAAPLLEEERGAGAQRSFAQVGDPLRADGAVPGPGLAADDQPVD